MSWDKRELSSLTLNDNNRLSFSYNSNGLRIQKLYSTSTATVNHSYTLDGSTILREVISTFTANSATTDTLYYFYDETGVAGFEYNGAKYHYIKNLQGDIVEIYDANGIRVVQYTYDAWGNVVSITGSLASTIGQLNPFRYRGYYYDTETDLYYLQSRYYDPSVGRFLNADKYASTGQGIIGYNMFAYCNNNPIIYADYLGTEFVLAATIAGIGQYLPVVFVVAIVVVSIEPEVYEDIIVGIVDFVDSVTDALSDALCNYCANYVI